MSNENNFNPDLSKLVAQNQQIQPQQPASSVPVPMDDDVELTPEMIAKQLAQAVKQQPVAPPVQETPVAPKPVLPQEELGGGIVIEQKKEEAASNQIPGMNPDTVDHIKEYMDGMEEDAKFELAFREANNLPVKENDPKEMKEALIQEKVAKDNPEVLYEEEEEEVDPEVLNKEYEDKYNEAIVVINKLDSGNLQLSEEEREKLEVVKKIKLEEIETVDLQQIKTKRAKRGSLKRVLKATSNIRLKDIVLPASGYTAKMKGASTYELLSLFDNREDIVLDTRTKWSIVHSKIEETSIGKMDFDTFLRETSHADYNMFLFGIACATYLDEDKFPLQCTKESCGKEFEHQYEVKSVLRAELMSDELKEAIAATIENSHDELGAKRHHANAPINVTKTIKLPVSGYIVVAFNQSAHDLIYRAMQTIQDNREDVVYNQARVLSSLVKSIYIQDPKSEDYLEYDDMNDVTEIIYGLSSVDILAIAKQSDFVIDKFNMKFGFMNVVCPHCRTRTEVVELDMENVLFHLYQQAMSISAE